MEKDIMNKQETVTTPDNTTISAADWGQHEGTMNNEENKPPTTGGKNLNLTEEMLQASVEKSNPESEESENNTTIPPFPVDCLPPIVRDYAKLEAESLGKDPSMIALPLLSALGAAMGNRFQVKLKNNWKELPILWTLIIGNPGTKKSPMLKLALRFTKKKQAAFSAQYKELQKAYEALPEADQKKTQIPQLQYVTLNDSSVEAIFPTISDNPRGLLWANDEFGIILSCFRTGNKNNSDQILKFWNGEGSIITRKNSPAIVCPENTVINITATTQTDRIEKYFREYDGFDSGLADRFIYGMPEQKEESPFTFDDDELESFPEYKALKGLFDSFFPNFLPDLNLTSSEQSNATQTDNTLPSTVLTFTKEAQQSFIDFHWKASELARKTGNGGYSKGISHVIRLALVLQLASNPGSKAIERQWVEAAIRVWEWSNLCRLKAFRLLGIGITAKREIEIVKYLKQNKNFPKNRTARELYRILHINSGQCMDMLKNMIAAGRIIQEQVLDNKYKTPVYYVTED